VLRTLAANSVKNIELYRKWRYLFKRVFVWPHTVYSEM